MLLSSYGSILKREIVHVESEADDIISKELIENEMGRIRDNIYEVWRRVSYYLKDERVLVRNTNDYLLPSIQPTNKARIIVNNFGSYIQRELILLGLLTYNIWSEYMKNTIKDIMIIKLAIPVLSSLIARTNVSRRPVGEELLTIESTIWLIYHYLSLYYGISPKYVKISEVEKLASQYYKFDWTMKQKFSEVSKIINEANISKYNGSTFLDLISEHLLNNTKDVIINILARRINNNIIYAFDEPMYAIIEVINSAYLKVHTLTKEVKDDVVSRILLIFKRYIKEI